MLMTGPAGHRSRLIIISILVSPPTEAPDPIWSFLFDVALRTGACDFHGKLKVSDARRPVLARKLEPSEPASIPDIPALYAFVHASSAQVLEFLHLPARPVHHGTLDGIPPA